MGYERKTKDVWELHTDFKEGTGYELTGTFNDRETARKAFEFYNEAEPQYDHKLIKRRK
jgi:hypothetical protein